MPYLGNTAGNRFVASKAATQFSGDGSNTAFTLDHAVGSDEDILVSVDGVIQEPSVAYAVSNVTTLTFTTAPSNNSGNNIFVYYLFRTVGTVSHPNNGALSASTGTFTGAVSAKGGAVFNEDSADVDFRVESNTIDDALFVQGSDGFVGIGTQSPSSPLDIEYIDGGVQLKIGRTNTTAGSAWFGADANALNIGVGAYGSAGGNVTTPNGIKVSSIGAVTKPYQPAFLAKLSSQQANIAINTVVTLLFATEVFDQNADYDNSTYTFTAPVTGRYQLNVNVLVTSIDYDAGYYQVQLTTSNRIYYHTFDPDFGGKDYTYFNQDFSVLADMDASDTVKVNIYQANGAAQTDIDAVSTFSGFLVC